LFVFPEPLPENVWIKSEMDKILNISEQFITELLQQEREKIIKIIENTDLHEDFGDSVWKRTAKEKQYALTQMLRKIKD
jgi:hypothetical protein